MIRNYGEKAKVNYENYLLDYCSNCLVQCNKAFYGGVGFRMSGSLPGLNFITNDMRFHTLKGLAYSPGTTSIQQLHKGNRFIGNTIGAEFEGFPTPIAIANNRYQVRNVVSEYPSHIPVGWFDPTSTILKECVLEGEEDTIGPHGRAALIAGIQSNILCAGSEDFDGACFKLLQDALRLIEDNPDVLEDEVIAEFYATHENSVINQLPLLSEIQAEIYNYTVGDFPYPDLEDTLQLTQEDIEVLKNIFDSNSANNRTLQDQRSEIITELVSLIDAIQTSTQIEDNFKSSLLWYLAGLNGQLIGSDDVDRMTDLANSCIEVDGPGILLCQALCFAREIPVNFNQDCPELENRQGKDPNSKSVELSPNPVLKTLSIKVNDEILNRGFTILDNSGRLIGNYKGAQFDVSDFNSGLYFIKFQSTGEVKKFIKL